MKVSINKVGEKVGMSINVDVIGHFIKSFSGDHIVFSIEGDIVNNTGDIIVSMKIDKNDFLEMSELFNMEDK